MWHDGVFFGIHYDLHTGPDETVLGQELTHEHLRAQLERAKPDWVQCDCKGVPGYTSYPTKVGTASPMVKDALRIHRDVTRQMGIPLVVHYCSIMNNLEAAQHPDWVRVNVDGTRAPGLICVTSPYTRELMIPQMLEIVDEYQVDGFWIDADVWAMAPCWCERCKAMFKEQYGVDAPVEAGDGHWSSWQEFHRQSYLDHLRSYTDAVHERDPSCSVCCNWAYSLLQPDPIEIGVDYLSGDVPYSFTTEWMVAESRFLSNRPLSWDLMTWAFVQPPEAMPLPPAPQMKPYAHLCQDAAIVIASGGASGFYVLPQRTGHLTTWVQDLLGEVSDFCHARKEVSHDTRSVLQVVVLHSLSHQRAVAQAAPALNAAGLYAGGGAVDPIKGAVLALLENHLHVDVLTEENLLERLDDSAMVVVPEQTNLPVEVTEALERYVRDGGRLLVSGPRAAADLPRLTGAVPEGAAIDDYRYVAAAGKTTAVKGPWQPVRTASAKALTMMMEQHEIGKDETEWPAVTLNEVGHGRVAAVHGPVFAGYFSNHHHLVRSLIGEVCDALAPDIAVAVDAPATVHLSLREKAGRLLVHLVNLGADYALSPRKAEIENVPSVGPITLRVRTPARPSAVVAVPDGDITWSWADGTTTVELTSLGIHTAIAVDP